MSAAIAPPASRNAPCPCDSGRRYKDCHGRVGQASAPPAAPGGTAAPEAEPSDTLTATMHAALAAQQEGRLDEAIALYDEVLRAQPGAFDAWHMRGVAHLLANRYDAAEADVARALALWPDNAQARKNLALIDGGRRNALDEEMLSRAVWPRFRPLVTDEPRDPLAGLGPGDRMFVVELGERVSDLCDRLVRVAGAAGAEAYRAVPGADGRIPDALTAALASAGPRDTIVAVGCRWPAGDWTLACAPRAIALVVDDVPLARIEDRLRELSGQARRRVRLVRGPGATTDLDPLPHAAMRDD